jgi:hypothetical protein
MSDIPGRFSTPPGTPSASTPTPTPIETKENPFEVMIHIPSCASVEGTRLPRVRTRSAKPQVAQFPTQAQPPAQDDAHGCCFRGCWSCVGCACFGGFLGALLWARAAAGH